MKGRMIKMKRIMISLIIGMFCAILSVVYTDSVMADLSDHLVRLHIIADSNSEEDQRIKLLVRDAIIEQTREQGQMSLEEVQSLAEHVLRENGFSYHARAEYGMFQFPRKMYDNIILPQGWYTGVRVVLGEGGGQNWWCVMYPPLCFTQETTGVLDENGQRQLADTLDAESYELITQNEDVEIEMKLKIVELVQKALGR